MTTYVLTLAERFQRPHPRTGDPTNFKERILNGRNHEYKNDRGLVYMAKIHTGRENYDLWKRRCDNVNKGKAIISLRQWIGVPYKTGQKAIGVELTECGIQKMEIKIFHSLDEYFGPVKYAKIWIDGRELDAAERLALIACDGFDNPTDFMHWFGWKDWSGAILHFDKYYKY